MGVMNKNADLFVQSLINLTLKTDLPRLMGAKDIGKMTFGFALVTGIGSGTSGSAHNGFAFIRQSESGFIEHAGIQYLDSPSSTSSLTYKIQGWQVGGQSSPDDVWTVNRRVSSAHYGASSQLTVMEIAG